MPLHRFDGFQVGVASDSSAARLTITLQTQINNSHVLREGEKHVSRDLRRIVITVPIRFACG